MLKGTNRKPSEVLGLLPPDLQPVTVEKVAVNAVMAGCAPEYMPVVIAAVEAVLLEPFNMHGVLATTMFCTPIVIVNGPVARAIGMNARGNALGQGNRANATIGRAVQLCVRNVGGGRPQGVDRSTLGTPGKYTFCFAEDEEHSFWEPLSVERGFAAGVSTVTVFAGDAVHGIVDQQSRTPESLSRTFALSLRGVNHWKLAQGADAILVVCPEHERTFKAAGWTKARLRQELDGLLQLPAQEVVRGAGGIAEGVPAAALGDRKTIPKFRKDGLLIVRAGGDAGMFSAMIAGWGASGAIGSTPVTHAIRD